MILPIAYEAQSYIKCQYCNTLKGTLAHAAICEVADANGLLGPILNMAEEPMKEPTDAR